MVSTLTDRRGQVAPTRVDRNTVNISAATIQRPQPIRPGTAEEVELSSDISTLNLSSMSLQVKELIKEGALVRSGQLTRETILRLAKIIQKLNKLQDFAVLGKLLVSIKEMKSTLGGKIVDQGKTVFAILERAGMIIYSSQPSKNSSSGTAKLDAILAKFFSRSV